MPPLTPDMLLQVYRLGAFPMSDARESRKLFWLDPDQRGILPLDGFRMTRSLARRIRARRLHWTLNRNFAGVLAGCADRPTTWINAEIEALFLSLHQRGDAHSIEIWDDTALVGGIYGLTIGGAFCAESMFSRVTDASKIALAVLVAHLRRCGFVLMDTQYLTDHLASLGGVEIPRMTYRARLVHALSVRADIRSFPLPDPDQVLQLRTHKS